MTVSNDKKHVASTLKDILDNPILQMIQDRRVDLLSEVIPEVEAYWDYDMYSRKPGPAYRDGIFVGTDLDLACFLYSLVDRKAVIQIPTYRNLRPRSIKEGEVLSSKYNRHGQILSLVSNKETFIFSVQIKDMNVMTTNSVGEFRNFSITNFEGEWYDGWNKIEFIPTMTENDFILKNKLWSDNSIVFKNFVSPNRWTSFYGQYYFITKALIKRLQEESTYLRSIIAENPFPTSSSFESSASAHVFKKKVVSETEKGKSITVNAFEVELDLPEPSGTHSYLVESEEMKETHSITDRLKMYRKTISKLQFMTRCTELSLSRKSDNTFPSWIANTQWQQDYVQPGKRKKWDRLILFQPKVGEIGVSLRKRVWSKSETVAHSYQVAR